MTTNNDHTEENPERQARIKAQIEVDAMHYRAELERREREGNERMLRHHALDFAIKANPQFGPVDAHSLVKTAEVFLGFLRDLPSEGAQG